MALRNVQRVTFSLPNVLVKKMEAAVPKNKRSKFVAQAIMKNIAAQKEGVISLEETHQYWENFRKKYNIQLSKKGESVVEWLRKDRNSH
jgi:metal-responsive CopG/Arc/MetJ family transcriptional regulator